MVEEDSKTESGMLSCLPLCMATLDPDSLFPLEINDMFEEHMGPLYKFANAEFVGAASDDKNSDARERFRRAIEDVTDQRKERMRIRNVEMTTLSEKNSGFPIRRNFDWWASWSLDGKIILLGDPCSEEDVEKREKDAELIDFFQNAPIAMHWLSDQGIILWANQTEMNVLGYTAEEYIGQNVMKFCPDEEELVLEIFKQLGGGNIIKDVPVRFRTKDGKLVHLLIDSNVRYNSDGSFGHTRCFIRDDTGRKIRESRASLLLEETKRSLKMLDNFMSRSLHHLGTPLHVTQNMVDEITSRLTGTKMSQKETEECVALCKMASDQISSSVSFIGDISDLAKFDQGSVLHIHPKIIDIELFGRKLLKELPYPDSPDVETVLELCKGDLAGDGPSMAVSDPKVLKRTLLNLLKNALSATTKGRVTLSIGYKRRRLTFMVSDTGPGLEMSPDAAEGDLPTIFQRYHQEFLPEDTEDLTMAISLREKIEEGINSQKKNGLGIGLSLTYHLVQALGGELECSSVMGEGTSFHFSLPINVVRNSTVNAMIKLPSVTVINKKPALIQTDLKKEKSENDLPMEITVNSDSSVQSSIQSSAPTSVRTFERPKDVLPQISSSCVAQKGVKSGDPPSVLVVEDTKACAKMLCMSLTKFNCSPKWAENGKIAVDILQESLIGTYDMVLMDLRMPVMGGIEATKIIKQDLKMDIPVIALTAEHSESLKEECMKIGFNGFYHKPMKRNILKEVVKKFTGYEVK